MSAPVAILVYEYRFVCCDRLRLQVRKYVQWPRKAGLYFLGEGGGAAVVVRAIQLGERADGIILCGPALKFPERDVPSSPMKWIMQRMAPMAPDLTLPSSMQKLTDKNNFLRISGNQKIALQAWEDPLVVKCTFLGTALSFIKVMPLLAKNGFKDIRLPLYVAHGKSDTRVDVSVSREVFAAANSHDKTLDIIEGACHQVCTFY